LIENQLLRKTQKSKTFYPRSTQCHQKSGTTGIRRGNQAGHRPGRAKIAIAQQLIGILDDNEISRMTGLDLDAIAQLQNN
jgi:hypothetical protein